MRTATIIRRSLGYYWRTHLGVVLGVVVATAVLVGALVVGDSVRLSLRRTALTRLGDTHLVLAPHDRFFTEDLAQSLGRRLDAPVAPVVFVKGTAVNQAADADPPPRANDVQVYGVDPRFWSLFPGEEENAPAHPRLGPEQVALNRKLAAALGVGVGDDILLRVARPTLLPLDAPLTRKGVADVTVALRLKVDAIVEDARGGAFSLRANQVTPYNAFINLDWLRNQVEQVGQSNVLLVGPAAHGGALSRDDADRALETEWALDDVGIEVRPLPAAGMVELRTRRVFLEPPLLEAATRAGRDLDVQPVAVLTYLVNEFYAPKTRRWTPYSMATAIGPLPSDDAASDAPALPDSVAAIAPQDDNAIVINDWLADDLRVGVGDEITLSYFTVGEAGDLAETQSAPLRIAKIVPMEGLAADKTLLPDFPDMPAEGATFSSWKPSFQLRRMVTRDGRTYERRIRTPKDDDYWDEHGGTPKAFITYARGVSLWSNRFGAATAVRFPVEPGRANEVAAAIKANLDPAAIGLAFIPARKQALEATTTGVGATFGYLFLGMSFFLIIAALLLTGLLFVFAVEQRAAQVGTLLAVGYRPRRVRLILLAEGLVLAAIGATVGSVLGMLYTKGLLWGLTTVWSDAVSAASLSFHVTPMTLIIGWLSSVVVALATMWLVLRRQGSRPARELIAQAGAAGGGGPASRRRMVIATVIAAVCALAAVAWLASVGVGRGMENAAAFFGGGSLLLVSTIALCFALLARMSASRAKAPKLTVTSLGLRNNARRRGRSLATIGLLACGSFLVIAIGAFWLDAGTNASQRNSGTGGFELFAETAVPVLHDLNTPAGLDTFALEKQDLPEGTTFIPMRVRDGDDASCLNLNRAQTPQLVGVDASTLAELDAFVFAAAMDAPAQPWNLLAPDTPGTPDTPAETPGETPGAGAGAIPGIPAIGDQNTIVYGLGKGLGDTIEYRDERGQTFRVQIVAMLSNSILQGSLFIDEDAFKQRFPSISGHRMFLIDTDPQRITEASQVLTEYLSDVGFTATPTVDRLRAFNAVQNTYLGIFQLLGGLGLLLGSIGLGIVVLRNVLERRRELALLGAVGFARSKLRWLVLTEHWFLLVAGLACGLIAALIAILPAALAPGAKVPYTLLATIILAVILSGLLWTWFATKAALRGPILAALREE